MSGRQFFFLVLNARKEENDQPRIVDVTGRIRTELRGGVLRAMRREKKRLQSSGDRLIGILETPNKSKSGAALLCLQMDPERFCKPPLPPSNTASSGGSRRM